MSEYNKGKYTEEELKTIEEMVKNDKTITEISEYLNRDYFSVHSKIRHMRLKPRKNPRYNYKFEVGEIVNGLKILKLTRYRKNRAYVVQSMVYKTAKPYIITESDLKSGNGDAYVSGHRVCPENSLYSAEHVRPYLVDIHESKNITKKSGKKISFKCDSKNCDYTKKIRVYSVVKQGFSCPNCSSNGFYPEQFFSSFNKHKNLGFSSQVTDLYKGYRFDFVNYENKLIVETHGLQHYDKKCTWYVKTYKSDIAKRSWCKDNGWALIELDCRKSDFTFIKNNINKEPLLPDIKKSDVEPILELINLSQKYPVLEWADLYRYGYSVPKISNMYNIHHSIVYNTLKKNNIIIKDSRNFELPEENICQQYLHGLSAKNIGKNYRCSYTKIYAILRRNNISIRDSGETFKLKVKCVNTGIIYESAKKASEWCGLKSHKGIQKVCNCKQSSAGKHPVTGEKLTWEYVDNE